MSETFGRSPQGFVVDTHLLRELGDLLVGRDSTAVLELVKNGYDADATVVHIDAQNLSQPEEAVLTVRDNGNGMTAARFRSAFLRIAGRDKEVGERRSPRYRRAYTGQKGIGRLASQKLARILEVQSTPDSQVLQDDGPGVKARIDWDIIDRQQVLSDLREGLSVDDVATVPGTASGTILFMRSLKRAWTRKEIATFINEVQSAQPPQLLLGRNSTSLSIAGESLIGQPIITSTPDAENGNAQEPVDPGFTLELSGELASGDDLWAKASGDFEWCIEIDVDGGRAQYQISPTVDYASSNSPAKPYHFEADADVGLCFQARIFMMPKASARRGPLKGFVRSNSGIRVYMEGFRVLPYGEYGDDWLSIDRDYRAGPRYYTIDLDESASDRLDIDDKEALNAVPSNGYFGAVFLTTRGTPGLESLVNREGFVPGPTFMNIQQIVRTGVQLSVRVRRSVFNQQKRLAMAKAPARARETNDSGVTKTDSARRGAVPALDQAGRQSYDLLAPHGPTLEDDHRIERAVSVASQWQRSTALSGESAQALIDGFSSARTALQTVQSIQPELRLLAGVGLQLGAFVHDINGMLSATTTIRELLRQLLGTVVDAEARKVLQALLRTADELAHTLARQSSYLTDVLSADPRRRRSQVKVRDRVDAVLQFLSASLAAKNISVVNEVLSDLRTGPMFPAELTILLTNLLTNAVKNAADGGTIWVDGTDNGTVVEIVVSNDGTSVDLGESERWFLPFESTTTEVDDVLGQGLGLGLPIVRALVDDYRGDVRFIEPLHGANTSIRVQLPTKRNSR